MWNLKCNIIPVIIGGTEIVTRGLRKNLEAWGSLSVQVPGRRGLWQEMTITTMTTTTT